MKEKLELRHLAPYLPYGLKYLQVSKGIFINDPTIKTVETLSPNDINVLLTKRYRIVSSKPILRPLSDLNKVIDLEGRRICPADVLQLDYDWSDNISIYDFSTRGNLNMEDIYFVVDNLYKWHFDVFSLIPKGLAIDLNTLDQ